MAKRLANLWKRNKVKKKAHAGRGQEIKWEIPANEASRRAIDQDTSSICVLSAGVSYFLGWHGSSRSSVLWSSVGVGSVSEAILASDGGRANGRGCSYTSIGGFARRAERFIPSPASVAGEYYLVFLRHYDSGGNIDRHPLLGTRAGCAIKPTGVGCKAAESDPRICGGSACEPLGRGWMARVCAAPAAGTLQRCCGQPCHRYLGRVVASAPLFVAGEPDVGLPISALVHLLCMFCLHVHVAF